MNLEKPVASITKDGQNLKIVLSGAWAIDFAPEMHEILEHLPLFGDKKVTVDGREISDFDTLGAWLIFQMFNRAQTRAASFRDTGFAPNLKVLIARTSQMPKVAPKPPAEPNPVLERIQQLGAINLLMVTHYGQLFTFIGFVLVRTIKIPVRAFKILLSAIKILFSLKDFRKAWERLRDLTGVFRMTSFVYHIEEVGFKALAIIGLMSFLIGAVIVNQGAIQLRQFGAEIFAIDLLAISVLREMGILLAAILIAGRSGSAFTAEIGSMKVREEVDALEVLGLNPVDVLVLPRMLALVFIMPFIAFYSDIMGSLGGALMSWAQLDISFEAFWGRFRDSIELTTFYIGLIKAPFFGAIIAINGCFEGLTVSGSAESVGRNTTRSVVQSIFMVIVLDALFAMFFTEIGW